MWPSKWIYDLFNIIIFQSVFLKIVMSQNINKEECSERYFWWIPLWPLKIFFISYQHNLLQNTLDKCTIITINCLLNQCTNTYVWYFCYLLTEASKKYGNLFFSSFIIFHCRATYLKCAVLWCFVQLHLSRNYFYLYQKERFWNYILNFPSIQWGVYL